LVLAKDEVTHCL